MSVGYEQGVPEILAAAGLTPLAPLSAGRPYRRRGRRDEGGTRRQRMPPSLAAARGAARRPGSLPSCRASGPGARSASPPAQAPDQQHQPDRSGAAGEQPARVEPGQVRAPGRRTPTTAMARLSSPTSSATGSGRRRGGRRRRGSSVRPVVLVRRSCSATVHLHVSRARLDVQDEQPAGSHAVGAQVVDHPQLGARPGVLAGPRSSPSRPRPSRAPSRRRSAGTRTWMSPAPIETAVRTGPGSARRAAPSGPGCAGRGRSRRPSAGTPAQRGHGGRGGPQVPDLAAPQRSIGAASTAQVSAMQQQRERDQPAAGPQERADQQPSPSTASDHAEHDRQVGQRERPGDAAGRRRSRRRPAAPARASPG